MSSISYTLLLAILSAQVVLTSGDCSLSCVQTGSRCKVCFNLCASGSSSNYYFHSCSQTYNSQNNQSSTTNYDSNSCSLHCCDDQLVKFQNPKLSSCPITTSSQSMTTAIIIIVLVVIFVVLCCIVSGHSKVRQKLVDCLTRKDIKSQDKPASFSSNISMSNSIDLTLPKQTTNKKLYNLALSQTICSICLENQSNVISKCGHAFHINCLYQWIIRKTQCPLCKSKQMQKVCMFCKKCYKNKIQITILELPYLSISRLNQFQCKQCKSIKQS